jgi:hypothetical protein
VASIALLLMLAIMESLLQQLQSLLQNDKQHLYHD